MAGEKTKQKGFKPFGDPRNLIETEEKHIETEGKHTTMNDKRNNKCTCQRCNYSWIARAEHPKECPNCKSRLWDAKR